jgi:hypothetical protein
VVTVIVLIVLFLIGLITDTDKAPGTQQSEDPSEPTIIADTSPLSEEVKRQTLLLGDDRQDLKVGHVYITNRDLPFHPWHEGREMAALKANTAFVIKELGSRNARVWYDAVAIDRQTGADLHRGWIDSKAMFSAAVADITEAMGSEDSSIPR